MNVISSAKSTARYTEGPSGAYQGREPNGYERNQRVRARYTETDSGMCGHIIQGVRNQGFHGARGPVASCKSRMGDKKAKQGCSSVGHVAVEEGMAGRKSSHPIRGGRRLQQRDCRVTMKLISPFSPLGLAPGVTPTPQVPDPGVPWRPFHALIGGEMPAV